MSHAQKEKVQHSVPKNVHRSETWLLTASTTGKLLTLLVKADRQSLTEAFLLFF